MVKPSGPPSPPPGGGPPRPSRTTRPSQTLRPPPGADEKPIALNIALGDEPASDLEKAEAIRDVMQHAATMAHEVALAKEMRSWPVRPITMAVLATLSLAISVYTFVGEPDWAFGPDPSSVSPVRRDAHLRFAMYVTAQRVLTWRDTTGTLPATLAELSEGWPGVEYQPSDSTFVLRARASDGTPIVLESNDDLRAFLGRSRLQLRGRR